MSKKALILTVSSIAVVGLAFFVLFTPWGVHFYGEILFPDEETPLHDATDYPTAVDETRSPRTIPLPAAVMQPSGIEFDEVSGRVFIVTDQAEIIELSCDFQRVVSSALVSHAPLFFRQGTIESVDLYREQLYVSGDSGEIQVWAESDVGWERRRTVPSPEDRTLECEGMAISRDRGEIFVGGDDVIHVLDQRGQCLRRLDLIAETKPNRRLSEYTIAGIDFYDGVLYIVTEHHSAILAVDPNSGAIEKIYALEGITEGAGLAVTEKHFYVVVDHELDEPSPGVKVYER